MRAKLTLFTAAQIAVESCKSDAEITGATQIGIVSPLYSKFKTTCTYVLRWADRIEARPSIQQAT